MFERKGQVFGMILFLAVFLFFSDQPVRAVDPYFSINKNVGSTSSRRVELYMQGPVNTRYIMLSNQPDFAGADWEPYVTQKTWYLEYGAGHKIVYLKFKDKNGNTSSIYSAFIRLEVPESMEVGLTINKGQSETDSRYAQLELNYYKGVDSFRISNDNDFSGLAFQQIITPAVNFTTTSTAWVLSSGSGEKTVWVQFRDANKRVKAISRKIKYNQPSSYIPEGSLIQGQTNTVYYYGEDGLVHPFLNSLVYHSWYMDFADIKYISNAKLRQYQIGEPICVRPGTWLLKFKSLPRVYAVEPGCQLRPLRSEAEAYLIYGANWQKRILELDLVYRSNYQVVSLSVADEKNKIVDQDRDGVDKKIEDNYYSNDQREDTDFDGLSDYEEIYYWFTDPIDSDTDRDGHKDGREILLGYSPTSAGKLTGIPQNAYEYPKGSIIKRREDGKLYYRHSDGNFYYAGKNVQDKLIVGNRLQERFIIDSLYEIKFTPAPKKKIIEKELDIYYPLKKVGERLEKL